jgi:hypothetical protein
MTLAQLISLAEQRQKTDAYDVGEAMDGWYMVRVVRVARKKTWTNSVLFYINGRQVKRHELSAAMEQDKPVSLTWP